MDSSQTTGSLIFTDQAMMPEVDSQQTNPPTLSDNGNPDETNNKSDTKPSVEITDQIAMADGGDSISKENSELDTDLLHASDCQEVKVTEASEIQEVEVTEVFYHNPNNNRTYDDTSEFFDVEDDNRD